MIGTVALAVIVAGCAATPTADAPPATAGTSSPTPTVSASPSAGPATSALATPTADPAESPAPAVDPASCDTVFDAAEYAQFETDGLTVREASPNANLDTLMAADGIRCLWRKPNTDLEAWYAQWPSDQATWEATRTDLLGAGATDSGDAFGSVLQPESNSALAHRDGIVYFTSPPRLLGSVLALR
ncbi:MAG: hypothetical protein JWP54_2171 [Cryobacterium sp.]|jgi:hypothetical protein|nr:hypothetical protein [Cryobacterium sp.]